MSVQALAFSPTHDFTKTQVPSITLLKGLGVEGDCHQGVHVQHRSRLHIKPPPANLRQVHLMQNETLQEYGVQPSEIGENVTTVGIDLLGLGVGTKLHFLPAGCGGSSPESALQQEHPILVVTGLRNPCPQIEKFRKGLQERFIVRDADRKIVGRKAGVMSTVENGGIVTLGMRIVVEAPSNFESLGCV